MSTISNFTESVVADQLSSTCSTEFSSFLTLMMMPPRSYCGCKCMIGRAVLQLLMMNERFDSNGSGARQPRGVQDTVGAVQQMCSNSAGAFASYLPSHAGRNDWDPVVGSPNGTAGPDPPGSHPSPFSLSLRTHVLKKTRTEKMLRQLLECGMRRITATRLIGILVLLFE